ncbi:MAG: DUF6493 family protein [Bacteroidota bacterium]
MNHVEIWKNIVVRHDESAIIPFLKTLIEQQKQQLLSPLGEVATDLLEIKDRLINHKHFFARKASNKQERILNYTLLVCLPNEQHPLAKWLSDDIVFTPFTTKNIFSWFVPCWLSSHLSNLEYQAKLPKQLTYLGLLELADVIKFSLPKNLIVKLLAQSIFQESEGERGLFLFRPSALWQRPETLDEHFWWLFEAETDLYRIGKEKNLRDSPTNEPQNWQSAILTLVQQQLIPSERLLVSILEALTHWKKKANISWLTRLFDALPKWPQLLLANQIQLFKIFSVPHALAVKSSLSALKTFLPSADFNVAACLAHFDSIVQSRQFSITLAGLKFLKKLNRKSDEYRATIILLVASALHHRHLLIQQKVLTFLIQFGNGYADLIQPIILKNRSNLFQIIRQQLNSIVSVEKKETTSVYYKNVPTEASETVNSLTEFIDLAQTVLDNPAAFQFDRFIEGLLRFYPDIDEATCEKLVPVFKKAFRLVFNELPSNQGMLDNMLATLLLDVYDLLKEKLQLTSNHQFLRLGEHYEALGFWSNDSAATVDWQQTHIYNWYNPYDPSEVYTPIKKVLLHVLKQLRNGSTLPLLSTITHTPMWVDAAVFVRKLRQFQEANVFPNPFDVQFTISRLKADAFAKGLELANQLLNNEYVELANYCFLSNVPIPQKWMEQLAVEGEKRDDKKRVIHPLTFAFATAAITKRAIGKKSPQNPLPKLSIPSSYFDGTHSWSVFWDELHPQEWSYKTQQMEFTGQHYIHRELQIKCPKGLQLDAYPDFLYQYLPGREVPFRPNVNDVVNLLNWFPNNPDPLISLILADNLCYPTFWEKEAQRRVEKVLHWLNSNYNCSTLVGAPSHLFVSVSLICGDSQTRQLAATVWRNLVERKVVDSEVIGANIGKMQRHHFVPLKRLTQLIQSHLWHLTTEQEVALTTLIEQVVDKLPAVPVANTKQLLRLYQEFLLRTQRRIDKERTQILLSLWKGHGGLRKVVEELEAFFG